MVVVDGDSGFRSSTERFLRAHGFEVEGYDHPARLLDGPPRDVPTCLLLELSLRDMSGLDVQGELVRRGHLHPLVFMSGRPDVTATVQVMKRGAADVLLKPLERGQLLEAIALALHRDERERAVRVAQGKARERLGRLTIREQQVCGSLMQGMINKQIAFALGLSESTVKVHRSRLMTKLGVRSLVELVRLVDRASGNIDAPRIGQDHLHLPDGSEGRMLTTAAATVTGRNAMCRGRSNKRSPAAWSLGPQAAMRRSR